MARGRQSPIHHPSLSAALGREGEGRGKAQGSCSLLNSQRETPRSQAGLYWPRHLNLGHQCSGEPTSGFLHWCLGALEVLQPIFLSQSLLPEGWGSRARRGLSPKQKQNKDLAPRERVRWRGRGEGTHFAFTAYGMPDTVQHAGYVTEPSPHCPIL